MHVYVVNQGGGGGGGLDDLLGGGPGIRPQRRFSAPRGGGINSGGNFLSRLMKGGKNQVLARPGSIINESTGRATRMLGGNRQSSVMNALKNAGVSNANRARVLSGMLDQGVAQKIAASGGPRWLQNLRGLGSMGMNLGRGVLSSAKSFGGNLLAGAMTLSGNAMDLAKGVGGSFKSLGGKAVSGISGSLQSLGKGIQNLNPMQALEQIRGGVSTKLDEIMKAEPLINTIKNLKDPKKIKSLVSTVGSKAKPALTAVKNARKALGPFKIPGVDALIGTLAAVAEIATGGSAGNAILGALGGVLGAAAGTSIGTPGGPPGMFIGALAGGSLGEVAGRALARTLAGILPPGVVNYTGLNGSPLFTDGSAPAAVKKARGGQIFGGKPTGDSVPAYLERGEYVLNRKAVSAIGPQRLNAINFGAFPRFQEGGKVTRQEGWNKFTQWGKEKGAKYPQLVSAQWALESGWGSALSGKNNFFGIKATSGESSTNHRTREVINGKSVYVNANFKNFDTPQDAVDHLVTQWYKNYKSYRGVNNAGSPNEAAAMLKSEGYATDPSYPRKLIELMKQKGVSSGPAYISGEGSGSSSGTSSGSSSIFSGLGSSPLANLFKPAFGSFKNIAGFQQGGQVIEYLTGDKSHSGYRADHGGSNYHEHLAFRTQPQRNAAMALLRRNNIRIGSTDRPGDRGYHGSGLAFDVPAAQVPVGQEPQLSLKVRNILMAGGFTGLLGTPHDPSGAQPITSGVSPGMTGTPGVTQITDIPSLTNALYNMLGNPVGANSSTGMSFATNVGEASPGSSPGGIVNPVSEASPDANVSSSSGASSITNSLYDMLSLGVNR